MLAEKIVVRTTATLLAGGAILGLLAFATQTPALGIALAILILASPPLLFTLAVGLKISSRSKKSSRDSAERFEPELGTAECFRCHGHRTSPPAGGAGPAESILASGEPL